MMIHLALDGLPDWAAGAGVAAFAYVHVAPVARRDGAHLSAGDRRPAAGRAGAGRRPADGARPVPRAGRQACALGAGPRAAGRDPRRCDGRDRRATTGTRPRSLRRPRVCASSSAMRRASAARSSAARCSRPIDLERENPNLIGGDQVCGSHHLAQNFLFRPVRGHARRHTPVRNLHLTGAADWPGAGHRRRLRLSCWRKSSPGGEDPRQVTGHGAITQT